MSDETTGVAGELAAHRSRVQREMLRVQDTHPELTNQGEALLGQLSSMKAEDLTADDLCNLDDKVAGYLRRITKAVSTPST